MATDKEKIAKLQKKSVEIEIEDVKYYLRFDLNALVRLEDAYGNIETAFDFEENPVGAIGKLRKILFVGLEANHPKITEEEISHESPEKALRAEREVYLGGGFKKCKVYSMGNLLPGNVVIGPSLIEGTNTTLVIPEDRKISVDKYGNMLMRYR